MGFLEKILERPKNERAVLLIPVGYPAKDSRVPILKKRYEFNMFDNMRYLCR